MADVKISQKKPEIVAETQKMVDKINKQYKRGLITEEERFNKVIDTWNNATDQVKEELEEVAHTDIDNPIFIYKDKLNKLVEEGLIEINLNNIRLANIF